MTLVNKFGTKSVNDRYTDRYTDRGGYRRPPGSKKVQIWAIMFSSKKVSDWARKCARLGNHFQQKIRDEIGK